MRTFLWVVLVFDQLFMLMISSADLKKYELTDFQAKELWGGKTDEHSKLLRQLHKNLRYVKRQQQLELTIAFALSVALWCYLTNPYGVGIFWAVLMVFIIACLRRVGVIQKIAYQLFERLLGLILKVSIAMKTVWWFVGLPPKAQFIQPQSKQELRDLLAHATPLNAEEKQRLAVVFEADEKIARDIMTKKNKVVQVQPNATLGPILLAELQKSGHGYFPVVTKKGQPEGILALSSLGDIQSAKQKAIVQELMDPHVPWVDEDMSLAELARIFLSEKSYIMLVRNQESAFTGVITIADLIKHLTGIS